MRRFGIRAALVFFWLALIAIGITFDSLGRRTQPGDDCKDHPTVASAQKLAEAGQHEAATELLVARSKVTIADDEKGIAAVEEAELGCISEMLIVVGQVSISDRIADGVDELARRATGTETPAVTDDQPADSSVGIGPATRSAIRVLVWLLPLLGLLYTVRELLVIRRDRQPGPIEVKPVTADASQKDLPTTLFQARLTTYLSDVKLAPPTRTVGGIGELVIPVIEAAESSGSGNLKAIGKLVQRLLAPEQGSEVEVVLAGKDTSWAATVQVKTRRGGLVQSIERLTESSWEALAVQVAAHVHIVVFSFAPVKRYTPGWSRWSDATQLAKYINALPTPRLEDLKALSKAEPSNLNIRLQLANAHWSLAETAIYKGLVLDDDWNTAASEHLQADTAASLAAVRLAGQLVEPWLNLAVSLTQSDKWLPPRDEKLRELREWMIDDGGFRGLIPAERTATGPADIEKQNSWLQHVAATILTRAAVRTLLVPIWWRWWHPQLRSSIPASSLIPFNRTRVRTILLLKSIRQYALLRRKVLSSSTGHLWLPRLILWTIRFRLAFHPRSTPQIAIRYNLALAYGWLGHLHQEANENEPPAWLRTAFRNQLFGAHFRISDVTTEAHVKSLRQEPDFHKDPAQKWMIQWLTDMGLATEAKPDQDQAWVLLHETAQTKAEVWEKQLHTALGRPTGGPAGLLATRSLHDLIDGEATLLKSAKEWISKGVEKTSQPDWAIANHKRKLPKVDRTEDLSAKRLDELLRRLLESDTTEVERAASNGRPLAAAELIAATRKRYQAWMALVADLEGGPNLIEPPTQVSSSLPPTQTAVKAPPLQSSPPPKTKGRVVGWITNRRRDR